MWGNQAHTQDRPIHIQIFWKKLDSIYKGILTFSGPLVIAVYMDYTYIPKRMDKFTVWSLHFSHFVAMLMIVFHPHHH